MKLKIRFFLTFSLLAVIPLALLTAIAYLQYYRVTEERMSDIISSQFENISQEALDSHDSAIQAILRIRHRYMTFFRTLPEKMNRLPATKPTGRPEN